MEQVKSPSKEVVRRELGWDLVKMERDPYKQR